MIAETAIIILNNVILDWSKSPEGVLILFGKESITPPYTERRKPRMINDILIKAINIKFNTLMLNYRIFQQKKTRSMNNLRVISN
jgi:hypothetical protein